MMGRPSGALFAGVAEWVAASVLRRHDRDGTDHSVAKTEKAKTSQPQWFKVMRMRESEIQCNGNNRHDHHE